MEGPTGELFNCVTCRRPDSAQSMVACDECSQWQHYGCAGVTATIADRSWLCCRCVASHNAVNSTQTGNINSPEAHTTFASARAAERHDNTTGPIRGRQDDPNFGRLQSSSNSNAGSVVSVNAIAHLRLRHLKEQKDLEDQKAERDREFLARKQQLEAEIALEELSEGCDRSVGGKSHRSIAGWVEQQCGFVHTSTPVQQKPETVAPSANPHPAIQQREERQRMQAIIQSGQQIQPSTAPKQAEIPVRNPPPAIAPDPRSNYLDSNPRFPPVAQNPVPPVPVNPLTLPPPSSSQFPGFPVMNNPYGTMYFPNIPDMPSSGADYQFAHPQGGVFINNPVRHPNFGLNVQPCAWQASEQHPPTVPPTVSADLGKGFPHATGRMITPQQLAARQVVSRDLPKFSGDPLEWPMFLSAFESTTAMCGIQPDENLARLQKSLVGSAREKVQNILTLPDAMECGRPDQIVYCLLSKIRKTAQPSVTKLETLVTFGREVRNMVTYMQSAKLNTHLDNPLLLAELVAKLPPDLQLQWGMKLAALPEPSLGDFCAFVSAYRTAACKVKLTSDVGLNEKATKGVVRKEKPVYLNAHSASVSSAPGPPASKVTPVLKPCLMCKSTTHRVRTCKQFETLPLEEKLRFISETDMCKRCLAPHGRWPCRNKQPCGINGCPEPHHKLLHPGSCSTLKSQGSESSVSVTAHHQHQQGTTFFKILPVTLHANGKSVSTFAFLDDGSDLTLVEDELIDELGLVGERIPLCLQWTSNVTRSESNSRKVEIGISGASNNRIHQLANVRTVESLELPKQSLDYESLSNQFPHLSGLPISSYRTAVPRILIGVDNAQLNLALKKRERSGGEPVAAKFRLGWAIFGGRRAPETIGSAFVHVCECSNSRELHEMVQQYFEFENLAISGLNPPESDEDRRARRLLEETTVRTPSGKFQTGLLWKSDEPVFPNNFSMAVRRHGCFERRLLKDPELKTNIDKQIDDYLQKGYVHKATSDELRNSDDRKIWYLPISAVRHPRKPTKVRVVWDAAATYGGTSLNSQLLKGPDLVKPLLSVLCRFRQKQYAIAGDIRQMFHQLIIRPEDRNAQRFLYRENPEAALDVYIMDVATFGATCSPCSAQFAKNKNAQEHKDRYPEAAEAIVDNTYVDDFLASCDTIEEATKLALEVSLVNRSAGFEIPSWQSNSEHLLKRVGVTTGDEMKSFAIEKTTKTERVLGMMWVPSEDVFVFSADFRTDLLPLLSGETRPTKRQVLQVVMSLFDPLGIVACYTIHGKILIQSIWRSGILWDDPICDDDFDMWQRWIKLTPKLENVRVPRCYFPNYTTGSYNSLQLHVFVDASELAYCAAAYFRIVDGDTPRCALVAAKAKVTPLRPQSIPRNELGAAVIGSRLLKSVEESHSLQITEKFLWTDSSTVMAWLRADPRKYRQFVGFRIAEILTNTSVEDWQWVPSRDNIADQGTKWGNGPNFDPDGLWYKGPEFLYRPTEEWPKQKPCLESPKDELRSVNVHRQSDDDFVVNMESFSRWDGLLNRVAYMYHFVHRFKRFKREPVESSESCGDLNRDDYVSAEAAIWRAVQRQVFAEEIQALRSSSELSSKQWKRIGKGSVLAKLSPVIDESGVLRMASRIDPQAAYYSFDFRNPVIIPRDHHVTTLLILRFHQKYGHANTETVLNELKQRYYIPRMRASVKKAIKSCMWCRVYLARPQAPKMAPLPQPRVKPYVRPFTFTGLDYFGPLLVKRGRSDEKRILQDGNSAVCR
ncbi:uncharacterized protein LOC129753308 [Uranotaenia lowii]|uniref:uncharacterized protein LOC129753308 n=1 Tax=Uranotaenia lowii TaxID=190385 RepID=UPI00247A6D32|nr:uncharacterized protein LOC129753308 [Uranotaenia lowii]